MDKHDPTAYALFKEGTLHALREPDRILTKADIPWLQQIVNDYQAAELRDRMIAKGQQ